MPGVLKAKVAGAWVPIMGGVNPPVDLTPVNARLAALEANAAQKGFKCLISSQLISGSGTLIFRTANVLINTGGYFQGDGIDYFRIPTGEPHAVSIFMRGDGSNVFAGGAQLMSNTGTSGYVAYDAVPAGHGFIQVSTVNTFNANDYVQTSINLFGNNVYCSGYVSCFRISI